MSKSPIIVSNVGAWYSTELNRTLIPAGKAADAALAAVKAARAQARRDISNALNKEHGAVAGPLIEDYGRNDQIDTDWSARKSGVRLSVDLSKCPDSAAAKILAAFKKLEDASSELCASRCRLRDSNGTADINRFKARVRALYGKSPTDEQCGVVFRAMVSPPKEAHACPLRKSR